MAIYIKGMEMPNSCDDCPINNDWRCALRINTPHQHNIDAGAWKYRMGWCPLVEVPKRHGRLIDADMLIHKYRCESISNSDIRNAPTVIEAEEE